MFAKFWRKLTGRPTLHASRSCRPTLELLEDRVTPSAYHVTNVSNDATTSGSLPWAVGQANLDTTPATIDFTGSVFAAPQTITLAGPMELSNTISINAPSAGLTLSGNNATTIFVVDRWDQATLAGLTIANGHANLPQNGGGSGGGGIVNYGALTVTNCTFANNSAGNSPGGAIDNLGSLTVTGCTFTNNSASTGGAIYLEGTASISQSSFHGNSASAGGAVAVDVAQLGVNLSTFTNNSASGSGGAFFIGGSGVVTVDASTIDSNLASYGAGITNYGATRINNSTLSGNVASLYGGAVFNKFSGVPATLTIFDSTIAGNQAASGGGIENASVATISNSTISGNTATLDGGGIVNLTTLTLQNSIVAGNTGAAPTDIMGGISNDGGHNLLGMTLFRTGTTDLFSDRPLLAPLGYYGGPTQTMTPLPGSPALGAGGPVTQLAGVASSLGTKITVANAAVLGSASGGFVIQVGAEMMLVTAVDLTTNTLTVQRGYNGTLVSTWNIGTGVYLTTDQRGVGRPTNGHPDIGAAQSRGFNMSSVGSNAQATTLSDLFAVPLAVAVSADAFGDPVDGGVINFSIVPGSNYQGAFLSAPSATIVNGIASVTATANFNAGAYQAVAQMGSATATFHLTNQIGFPATIQAITSTPLNAPVGSSFLSLLQVVVTDRHGNPVPGQAVTFAAPAVGASGSFAGSPTIVTDARGIATAPAFTANHTTGAYAITASLTSGLATKLQVTNTAVPATIAPIAVASGRSVPEGGTFTAPLQAVVKDARGNPVVGITVTFEVPASGPTGTLAGSATVVTNASGIATAPTLQAGVTPGTFTATAWVNGVATPATFALNIMAPPAIQSVSPAHGPVAGGTTVTLLGTSFGATGTANTVTIGGVAAKVLSATSTRLVIASPPAGAATSGAIVVTVAGQSSTATPFHFTYDAPVITSITSNHGPTAGGTSITINGVSFAPTVAGNAVTIGRLPTKILSVNAAGTQLIVLTPAGSGAHQPVAVTVNGRTSSSAVSFNYDLPTIAKLSTNQGPAGTGVVIQGTGFATQLSDNRVTIGGLAAAVIAVNNTGTQLTITAPPGTATGTAVIVTVNGQKNAPNANANFTYPAPTISTIAPAHGPAAGGTVIYIQGTGFASSASGNLVTIGGVPAKVEQLNEAGTIMLVLSPPGTGANRPLVIKVNGQSSNSKPFSYDPPVVFSATPTHSPLAGGTLMTLTGLNFSPTLGRNSVTIGGVPAHVQNVNADGTQIVVLVPPGKGKDLPIIVTTDDQSSSLINALLFTYDTGV